MPLVEDKMRFSHGRVGCGSGADQGGPNNIPDIVGLQLTLHYQQKNGHIAYPRDGSGVESSA